VHRTSLNTYQGKALVLLPSEDLTNYQNIQNCFQYVFCIQDALIISYNIACNNSMILLCIRLQGIWKEASLLNLLKPNDIYICRTAALTSRRYILNIYSTNVEHF